MIKSSKLQIIYKLYFPNGVHIGKNKLEDAENTITADTLFSAICHEAIKMGSNGIEELMKKVNNSPFCISDGFPFLGEELYLPKPYLSIKSENKDSSVKKLYKKINYVPLSMWHQYIRGESNPKEILELQSKVNSSKVHTKIKHNDDGNHNIYSVGINYFTEAAGLYFVLQCNEEDEQYFSDLIYSLSYSGLGGKRSSGVGRFEYLEEELPELYTELLKKESSTYVNISIASPKVEELQYVIENSKGFSTIRRGGMISSVNKDGSELPTKRKKDLFMLKSGSSFTERFKGEIVDVSDDFSHPVYRYGKPLFIGV